MTSPTPFAAWFDTVRADRSLLDTSMDAAIARHAAFGDDPAAIPAGPYCYFGATRQRTGERDGLPAFSTVPCPFWAHNPDAPEQASGYCAKLASGDWMDEGTMLLWDGCKECGLNDPEPPHDDPSETGTDEA